MDRIPYGMLQEMNRVLRDEERAKNRAQARSQAKKDRR